MARGVWGVSLHIFFRTRRPGMKPPVQQGFIGEHHER